MPLAVLLLADRPAGDKVNEELVKLGADVDYRCNLSRGRIADAAKVSVARGVAWVVAMNARSAGVELKEICRRHHARYVSVPPHWSGTLGVLKDCGLLDDLERSKAPNGTEPIAPGSLPAPKPLTYRPFEGALASEAPAPEPSPTPAVPEAPTPPPPAAPAPPSTIPATARAHRRWIMRADRAEPADEASPMARPAKNGSHLARPTFRPPDWVREKARRVNTDKTAAKEALVREILTKNPSTSVAQIHAYVAKKSPDRKPIDRGSIYRLRIEFWANHGLGRPPKARRSSWAALGIPEGQSKAYPLPASPAVPASPSPPVAAPRAPPAPAPRVQVVQPNGGLPQATRAALELLLEAMRGDGITRILEIVPGQDIAWEQTIRSTIRHA